MKTVTAYVRIKPTPVKNDKKLWKISFNIQAQPTMLYSITTKPIADKYEGPGTYKLLTYMENGKWYTSDMVLVEKYGVDTAKHINPDIFVFKCTGKISNGISYISAFAKFSDDEWGKKLPKTIVDKLTEGEVYMVGRFPDDEGTMIWNNKTIQLYRQDIVEQYQKWVDNNEKIY